MASRNGVPFEDMSDDELADVFEQADRAGRTDRAAQALSVLLGRSGGSAPVSHDVPGWLAGWLPSVFWHQKGGGGGG